MDVVWVWREGIGWHEAPQSALEGRTLHEAAAELRARGTPAHQGSRSIGPPDGSPVVGCCVPDPVELARNDEPLTKTQARVLSEVRSAGVRTYNGRARSSLEELERRGLVSVVWEQKPPSGSSGNPTWLLTARALDDEAQP